MKKALTAAAAVLFAAAVGFAVYFICRASEKSRIEKAFENTVQSVRRDVDDVLSGKSADLSYVLSDVNSLITLCTLDGRDEFGGDLSQQLLISYAFLQSRPEACRENIRMLYDAAGAYLSDKDEGAFTKALDDFNEAAKIYTATK